MKLKLLSFALALITLSSCKKDKKEFFIDEDGTTFTEIGTYDVGDAGAAEISTYDTETKRLYVVNNGTVNKIDVFDFSDPKNIKFLSSINTAPYGGLVNSLSAHEGKVAAAIEANNKQAKGKIVVLKTADNSEIKVVEVGAMPDMVAFTPNGKYILSANEGEPNDNLTENPDGTISIIDVANNYTVTTLNFAKFASSRATLINAGFRVSIDDFAKDIEPEYITISEDSKTAYVTLQENNGIAKIDIASKNILSIIPLGYKNYNIDGNEIDVSDKDGKVSLSKFNLRGLYMPDALAIYTKDAIPYIFTANEGDAREYAALTDVKRLKDLNLDLTAFPSRDLLKTEAEMGRLNIITNLGDNDNDGDYEMLYGFGSRSFSVWNGNTGAQIFDSKNELDKKAIEMNVYDDNRSDDKSVEPEGITIGKVGNKTYAFVGLERADAVAIYDISNPQLPKFIKMLSCGDAPEGLLFIPAINSPINKSLLVVSSENDGVIKVYSPLN